MRAVLFARATAPTLVARRDRSCSNHTCRCHVVRHGGRQPSHQPRASGADIGARARYAAEPLLAAARVLPRHEADPCGEIPPPLEHARAGDAGNQGARKQRPNAWYLHEPLPDFRLMLRDNPGGENTYCLIHPCSRTDLRVPHVNVPVADSCWGAMGGGVEVYDIAAAYATQRVSGHDRRTERQESRLDNGENYKYRISVLILIYGVI